ncbi:hypothetical protein NX059_007584 [Plenodomus lindquistii]|nr:hypothetical protein NX059_007584 [Plenodomus lindquistii]
MSLCSDSYRPPTPPSRTASAPAILQFGPSLSSPPVDVLPLAATANQGSPNDSLGVPGDDISIPDAYRSIDSLVTALLQPPPKAWRPQDKDGKNYKNCVRIDMQWVKATVSEKHFFLDHTLGRSVLRQDSKVRTHGVQYGLPKAYHSWLCGDEVMTGRYKVTREQLWMGREDFRRETASLSY